MHTCQCTQAAADIGSHANSSQQQAGQVLKPDGSLDTADRIKATRPILSGGGGGIFFFWQLGTVDSLMFLRHAACAEVITQLK